METTEDGHYVVISGRRWRATDPAIPEEVAAELRKVLMAARRAVGKLLRAGEDPAPARGRVRAAKVALGERGAQAAARTAATSCGSRTRRSPRPGSRPSPGAPPTSCGPPARRLRAGPARS